jgi:hypothetical protein
VNKTEYKFCEFFSFFLSTNPNSIRKEPTIEYITTTEKNIPKNPNSSLGAYLTNNGVANTVKIWLNADAIISFLDWSNFNLFNIFEVS